MEAHSNPQEEKLERLLEPVVNEFGFELYDLELVTQSGRTSLVVTADKPGGRHPGEGVLVDQLAELNRELSALLDIEDPLPDAYTLEVASPGVERDLKRPRHYRQAVGEEVHVVFNTLIDRRSDVDGQLLSFDAESATIVVERAHDGEHVEVPLDLIKRANTTYDWDARERKPGKQKKRRRGKSRKSRKKKRK